MCAICVMMRRRQEREANAQTADDHIESSGGVSVPQKARVEVHIFLKMPYTQHVILNLQFNGLIPTLYGHGN